MDQAIAKVQSLKLMEAFLIGTLVLIGYAVFLFAQEYQHEHSIEETNLVQAIEKLNEEIEIRILQLECITQPQTCILEKEQPLIFEPLLAKLDAFTTIAADEKDAFSLVGAVEFLALEISIKRYLDNSHRQDSEQYLKNLFIELTRNHLLISKNYRHLLDSHIHHHVEEESQRLVQLYAIYASIASIAIFAIYLARHEIISLAAKEQLMANELDKIGTDIEKLDAKELDRLLNQTNISIKQRRIYSYLKHIWITLERQRQNNDLHNQLYAMIGYEMRTITNTIGGCMQYFLQDESEDSQLMANSVIYATKTLSDLASNYNRLISQGAEAETGEFTFLTLISELMVSLGALAQSLHQTVNYSLEDNLPQQIEGQSISLFWLLFIQLSNAINQTKDKHLLVKISSSTAQHIEKSRLTICVYFLTSTDTKVKKLESLFWGACDNLSSNKDEFAKRILNNEDYYQSRWLSSGNQFRFEISFDVKVKSYPREKANFKDKKALLFCDYLLRGDVIERMLAPQQLKITSVDSVNALFACSKQFKEYDAIIVSLNVPTSKVASFYKTISSQLRRATNTKLVMIAPSQIFAIEYRTFAENVVHFPSIPSHFIAKMQDRKSVV